jgi:hypothetical protein
MAKYRLDCSKCIFSVVIDGSVGDVFDAIDQHQAEADGDMMDHHVNFELLAE